MDFQGITISVWQAQEVHNPEILPPSILHYSETPLITQRSHPPVMRASITAVEGDYFYVDLTHMLDGGAEELALQLTVFGVDPLTGGKLATPGLRFDNGLPNFIYLPQAKPRNRYVDGWAVKVGPNAGMVAQFYWALPGSQDDVVATKIRAQMPEIDFASNKLAIKVFRSIGQLKSMSFSSAKGMRGASAGAGQLIKQGWQRDPDYELHGPACLQKWEEAVTFVYEVEVLPRGGRPGQAYGGQQPYDGADTGFFNWGALTKK